MLKLRWRESFSNIDIDKGTEDIKKLLLRVKILLKPKTQPLFLSC